MGIFSGLFQGKKEDNDNKVKTEKVVSKEPERQIKSILEILSNLGLLNEDEIAVLSSQKYSEFDYSVLKRLMIKTNNSDFSYLKNYFTGKDLGYGSQKINQFKNRLYEMNKDLTIAGRDKYEIVEELIAITKVEIDLYEKILRTFNESVRKVESSSITEEEKKSQIEYWTKYYKEQELGYPISIEDKIRIMEKELATLPYGGYGEVELKKFRESATKYAEEGRIVGENQSETYSRIKSALFDPKKTRFLSDVETLKRKLQMIDESPYHTADEKERNKEVIIVNFRQQNGHILDIEGTINQLKLSLELLEYGGYGDSVIKEFVTNAKRCIATANEKDLNQKDVIDAIKREYNILVSDYESELAKLKDKLNQVQNEMIPLSEKERKQSDLIEDFQDSMGHQIDYKERINKMIEGLRNLEHGGYGDSVISEFKERAISIIKDAKSDFEIAKSIKDVRKLYNRLVQEYHAKLDLYLDKIKEIRNNPSININEQEEQIDALEKNFKFGLGFRMNFDKIVRDLANELSTLEKGGYGEQAINEFKKDCSLIIEKDIDEKEKYNMIKHKQSLLKTKYFANIRIFANWKMMCLSRVEDKDKEATSRELDSKISYMLSLSPKELINYYMEDDKKKKEETDKYNTVAACKYLARKEAEHHDNSQIYKSRIEEINKGVIPYSKEKIEKAKNRLEMLTITNDEDLLKEERFVTTIDYIESTLLTQMLQAELLSTNNTN